MKQIKKICSKAASISKIRAKSKNMEYDIDIPYLISIYPTDHICPILGYKMEPDTCGKRGGHKYSPSLDRINSKLGYIKGNVQWVSYLANCMFSSANGEDVIRFAKWAINRYNITMEKI
jgi:hypothetical protein